MSLLAISCSSPKNPPITIKLLNNNHSVILKGLDYAILSEINRDSAARRWQSLIPVYKMPADTELKDYQPVQPGQYKLIDSAIVFTPDTPFEKGKFYFMRYYKFEQNESIWDLIKGAKKPGTAKFTDFPFKDQ